MRCILVILVFLVAQAAHADTQRWKAEGWKTDFSNLTVPEKDILSGGPPKDGIPSIDRPKFSSVANSKNLKDREPVIALSIKGDTRAYPLRIMTWHEIVNDTVGGTPVTVTYCPLCNAALVFDATLDGKALSFGTTGKLRNSDLIMYDRLTESWWQQFTGEAIAGHYVGKKLKLLPARLESWGDFKRRSPEAKVLVPNNPGLRPYGRNPYAGYDTSSAPFLYSGAMPEGISPMARVVVVRKSDDNPLVISLAALRDKQELQLGGFTLRWKPGQASALDQSTLAEGRDVGSVVVVDQNSGVDVPHDVTFAFVAHAFHPEVKIQQ